MTPTAYLMTLRIDPAQQLLAGTDQKISEIGLEIGFYDQSQIYQDL